MSYIQAVNIIKGVSEAVNPTGIFVHGRTWDASLEFSNLNIQIYLYPFTGNVDLNNSYFESYQITMGFYFQDEPDSTNEDRQDLIQRADNLTREFLASINLVEGVEISGVRVEPSYRKMAGTYTGYLLTFTFGIDTNICGSEVEPDIPTLPTFCEKVDECLGISASGSTTKYLNEQGEWVTVTGGGGSVIQKTKAEFLALLLADGLTFPATYEITDIEGFGSVFIDTTSASSFSPDGSGLIFAPDYVPSGINLGQLDANNIPTIANGEKVIWGDHYWINNTGSPITPTILNNAELDGGLTMLYPKTAANYGTIPVDLKVDIDLNVTSITNPANNTYYNISGTVSNIQGSPPLYIFSQFNYLGLDHSDLTYATNFYSPNTNRLISITENKGAATFANTVDSNSAFFDNLQIHGRGNTVINNVTQSNAKFDGISLFNNCEFSGNQATGSNDGDLTCQQSFIELFDYCQYKNNLTSGNGSYIFDVNTGENSQVNDNTFSGINSGLNDIDQMYGDEANGNTISGDYSSFSQIRQNGYSQFNDNTITGDNSGIVNTWQEVGYLTGCTISSNNKFIQRVTLLNAWLKNANNIAISDLKLCGKTNTWSLTIPPAPSFVIDLTGFTTDINGETIEGGKGWFTITHDFSTSPLTSGSSALYNIIPTGARLTNITAVGSLTGTNIEIGLEADDEGLINAAVGLLPLEWSSISNAATANRSLKIKATGGGITNGTLTVKVEFVI